MTTSYNPSRSQRIEMHADWIAKTVSIDRETITTNGHGVVLTPNQLDMLTTAITNMGFQNAIDLLQATADAANAPGPDHSTTQWAVFHVSAKFLEAAKPPTYLLDRG